MRPGRAGGNGEREARQARCLDGEVTGPSLLGSWQRFAVIYTGVGRVEWGLRIGVQSPQGRGGSWGAGRGQSELSPEL